METTAMKEIEEPIPILQPMHHLRLIVLTYLFWIPENSNAPFGKKNVAVSSLSPPTKKRRKLMLKLFIKCRGHCSQSQKFYYFKTLGQDLI